MIRLRHIRHPIRSARSLYRQTQLRTSRWAVERRYRKIPREHREVCWCGGSLEAFEWHTSYGVCAKCACYVNRRPPTREGLDQLYSFDFYWHSLVRQHGQPVIEERAQNDRTDGRVDYWLGLIKSYGPSSGRVVEVGCAHGVLLAELSARGYDCVGLEPDPRTAQWTRQRTGLDVRAGFFPDESLPTCDLFLALDVIEHSPDPLGFLRAAGNLLNRGGIAIIQTPIDRYEFKPPFGERFADAFKEMEHLFLFTNGAMQKLGDRAGLQVKSMSERLWLHHEICVFVKS